MRNLLNRKIVEQNMICAICLEEFTDYNDVVPDHKDPKGMGGAWRDDHPDNIQATHWWVQFGKRINQNGGLTADQLASFLWGGID
jgi:hypothetical protein